MHISNVHTSFSDFKMKEAKELGSREESDFEREKKEREDGGCR